MTLQKGLIITPLEDNSVRQSCHLALHKPKVYKRLKCLLTDKSLQKSLGGSARAYDNHQ